MMYIDTGKALVCRYNSKDNIVHVKIYVDGAIEVKDIDDIHAAIEQFDVDIPVDTICEKSGKNYLTDEAFEHSLKHNCIHNKVVFVIKHMSDIHFPSEAQETYFKDHLVDYCTSVEDAYRIIKNMQPKSLI